MTNFTSKATGYRERFGVLSAAFAVAMAMASATTATAADEPVPRFSTGGVSHATATSGQLEGIVNTEGYATSYEFEYGPTLVYGSKTKLQAVPIPSPLKPVKVGQQVTGLLVGYHYRIVGFYTNHKGEVIPRFGLDKQFTGGKLAKLRFVAAKGKEEQVSAVYGGSATLSATLSGTGNSGLPLSLQATPFPFTTPFATVAANVVSGRTGAFMFKLADLTQSTEVRFVALLARPLYSSSLLIHVSPRISVHVRAGGHTGLYRVYGTVSPARNGASVVLQQLLPQRAGSKREGPRAHAVSTSVLKRARGSSSRYSIVALLTGTYRYRIFVRLPKGSIESGNSANVLIRSPKKTAGKLHK